MRVSPAASALPLKVMGLMILTEHCCEVSNRKVDYRHPCSFSQVDDY